MTSFRLLSLASALVAVLAVGACNNKSGSTGAATAPTGLSDQGYSMGNPTAKVTVVEYGSLTCPHCARWEEEVWPTFKAKYVDTGKVHYVFREALIHPDLDAAGALLARCVPADKYFPTVQAIFRSQPQIFAGDTRGALLNVAKAEGMSEQQFNACLSDTKGLERVNARQKLVDDAKINSTPTFVINGKTYDSGEMPMDKMSEAIDPLLKG
jgi:protein-disulfide isomerase